MSIFSLPGRAGAPVSVRGSICGAIASHDSSIGRSMCRTVRLQLRCVPSLIVTQASLTGIDCRVRSSNLSRSGVLNLLCAGSAIMRGSGKPRSGRSLIGPPLMWVAITLLVSTLAGASAGAC